MPESPEQVVARIYDAWGSGDFSVGLGDLDPHVTFVIRPPSLEQGVVVGPDAISQFMLRFLAQFEPGSLTVKADQIRRFGDTVMADVTTRGIGRTTGLGVEAASFMLFTFRGRSIVRIETVLDEDEALAAVEQPD